MGPARRPEERTTPTNAAEVDQPIAGLLSDLKARGLLDETLVLWGGEFGRTPTAQGDDGRDHNPHGFTMWLAGGGVKAGFSYGSHRRLRLLRRARTKSTSTTCTPRCCTCWGSTTRDSPTATPAATSA